MRKNDGFITGILLFFVLIVFSITIFFCLDIFGIIDVPKEYSIASYLGTRVVDTSVGISFDNFDETITNDTIDEWINAKHKVSDNRYQGVDDSVENIPAPDIATNTNKTEVTANNEENKSNTQKSSQTILYQNENVVNRMYYSQLDVYGKLIYMQFNEHRDELITGTYVADFGTDFNDLLHQEGGDEILEKAFQLSLNSLMFDNPELFYIDITKIFMSTEITTVGPIKTYRIKIGPAEGSNYLSDYFQDLSSLYLANNELESFKNNFAYSISGLSDLEKVVSVHDYLVENTEYDQSIQKSNIYNVYGTLIQHEAVCEGYSKAVKFLLDAVNVPCVIACGIAQNTSGQTESHAWNYIKLDGKWYAVDCTWDDPVIIGSGYVKENVYTKYLLKGSDEFFLDHFEDGKVVDFSSFAYPTISKENYNW